MLLCTTVFPGTLWLDLQIHVQIQKVLSAVAQQSVLTAHASVLFCLASSEYGIFLDAGTNENWSFPTSFSDFIFTFGTSVCFDTIKNM